MRRGNAGGSTGSRLLLCVLVVGMPIVWIHGWYSAEPPSVRQRRGAASQLPPGWIEMEDPRDPSNMVFVHLGRGLSRRSRPSGVDEESENTAVQRSPPGQEVRAEVSGDGQSEWLKGLSNGLSVTLYSGQNCGGREREWNMSHREARCQHCLDTCERKFSDGSSMHGGSGGLVASMRVKGTFGQVKAHASCVGVFEYPDADESIDKERGVREEHGCVAISGKSHFRIILDPELLAQRELIRKAAEAVDPPPPPPSKELAVGFVEQEMGPDSPVSRYQARDWLKPLKRGEVLQNYTPRFRTQEFETAEREIPCANVEADAANQRGVFLVRAHINYDYPPNKVDDPAEAVPHFEEALSIDDGCPSALLNLAILKFAISPKTDLSSGEQLLQKALVRASGQLRAKVKMWQAIYQERQGGQSAPLYHEAFDLDPRFPLRYFGRPHKSWGRRSVPSEPKLFYDPDGRSRAVEIQAEGMKKLLLYFEFAEYYGGYGSVHKSDVEGFLDRWSIHLRRLVPPYPIAVMREAYRELVKQKLLSWQGAFTKRLPENRWTQHNGPLARFTQAAIVPRMEALTHRKIIPTYAFMGAYIRGGGIIPHLDREVCEYTLTLTIDASPETAICPFGVAAEPNIIKQTGYSDEPFVKNNLPPEDKQLIVDSYVGDGALCRGRGVVHWRPPNPHANCTQFFLHYVISDFEGHLN
eukprot:Hpha_TRINITY_DN33464_c0_g1::TRINITY_DN33464_c0_g1_i1::g.762::m.762